jgi:hypothetical protein
MTGLRPYLVRPDHPESVFRRINAADLKTGRKTGTGWGSGLLFADDEDRPGGMLPLEVSDKLKLWYRNGHQSYAELARDLLIEKDMYNRFQKIMGKEPVSDALATFGLEAEREEALARAGGDGRLDIYLVPPLDPALTDDEGKPDAGGMCRGDWEQDDFPDNSPCPAYILVAESMDERDLGSTLAHELFHAFQHAWDAAEADWWSEGTAVWAEDFIDPSWDTEHDRVPEAFDDGRNTLIDLRSDEGNHPYGIFLFPYFLTKVWSPGDDDLIGRIWAACPGGTALDAVEARLNGDFEEAFKEFALLNFDDAHVPGCVKNPDGYPEIFGVFWDHETDQRDLETTTTLETRIPPLGARYLELKNRVEKESLPHVLFDLRKLRENPRLKIHAVFEKAGSRRCEDWSEKEERSLCLNFEEEDFDTLFLTISNVHRTVSQTAELPIAVDAETCFESYIQIHSKDTWFYQHKTPDRTWTQTHHYEATVKIPFSGDGFSANPGVALPGLGPYGAATLQGGEPAILTFKAEETAQDENKREVKTGSGAYVYMPGFAPKAFPKPDGKESFTLSSYFICPYYFDNKTGDVKFAIIPEVDVVFKWSDGKQGKLSLKPVAKKKVAPPEFPNRINEEFLVSFSGGADRFGGEGSLTIDNSEGNTTDRREKKYRWEIHRGKAPAQRRP